MNSYIISETEFDPLKIRKNESIMCRGNGYMCIRASLEERYPEEKRGTFINGVFDGANGEVSELAVLPDTTRFDIYVDGERVFLTGKNHTGYSRTLDMETGEAVRVFTWESRAGKKIKFKFRSFVSQEKAHIAAYKAELSASESADVKIITGICGEAANTGVQHIGAPVRRVYENKTMGLYAKTLDSCVDIAVHCSVKCSAGCTVSHLADRRSLYKCIEFTLGEKSVVTEKLVSYVSSRDPEYDGAEPGSDTVAGDGKKYLENACSLGYDALFNESAGKQRAYWKRHGDKIVSKNGFYDRALKFALYHLNIMTSQSDNRVGIGAKGMSGEGYKGHSYWDTEIFIMPHFMFAEPEKARRLLEYRFKLLKSALKKAERFGFKGAMYPWEAAWITDGETCPEYGDIDLLTGEARRNLMGEIEVHISADIAYAVWQYYTITGDTGFMESCGCEIILLTALFWCSRVTEKNGRLEILNVIGPDEYKDCVDNNAYTNYMAYFNLKLVSKIKDIIPKRLKEKYDCEKIVSAAKNTAERLYLPKANENGIIPQFDGYAELKPIDLSPYKNKSCVGLIFKDYGFSQIQKMQVSKQADTVMLFYLLSEMFDKKTVFDNFKFYEERTVHDSSLSMCIHSLLAARLGIIEAAEKMFYKACSVDLGDTDNSDDGIHSASIGGIWLALAMGFCGLGCEDGVLSASPVLPVDWESFELCVEYRGALIKIGADAGGAFAERLCGDKTKIKLNGKYIEV